VIVADTNVWARAFLNDDTAQANRNAAPWLMRGPKAASSCPLSSSPSSPGSFAPAGAPNRSSPPSKASSAPAASPSKPPT
jgi:hypothetical protein